MKYLIGQVVFDSANEVLICGSEVIKPRMKVTQLLKLLIQNADRLVTRDELIDTIWDGNYLTGNKALNSVVYSLRNLLNGVPQTTNTMQTDPIQSNVNQSNAIETVPKRGYRLVAPVVEVKERKTSMIHLWQGAWYKSRQKLKHLNQISKEKVSMMFKIFCLKY